MSETTKPTRIQLSRRKGWKMPPNTVKVDRTTKWGNPFEVGRDGRREECVILFATMLSGGICISMRAGLAEAQRDYISMARREIVGGWHGSPDSFTLRYPAEEMFIDAAATASHDDFKRGYTLISCGLRVEALVDWWLATGPDWGLALVNRAHGMPQVEPMRDRSVKCFVSPVNVVARLLPGKPPKDAKHNATYRSYFMGSIEKRLASYRRDHPEGT